MQDFLKPTGLFLKIANKNKKFNEVVKVSLPLEFENKKYRQITFLKRTFKKNNDLITGIMIVDENGNPVTDKMLLRELLYLGYYFEILVDKFTSADIQKTLYTDKEKEKEKIDLEYFEIGLDAMRVNSETKGTDVVLRVFSKMIDVREQNANAIENVIEKVNEYLEKNIAFNIDIINEIMPLYRVVLSKNLEKLKIINKGRLYYDEMKTLARKGKKKIRYKLKGNSVSIAYSRLELQIGVLKRMLMIYEEILDMNEEKYFSFLSSKEKVLLSNRMNLLR